MFIYGGCGHYLTILFEVHIMCYCNSFALANDMQVNNPAKMLYNININNFYTEQHQKYKRSIYLINRLTFDLNIQCNLDILGIN